MDANTIYSSEQADSNRTFFDDWHTIPEPSQFNWILISVIGISIFFGFIILVRSILYYDKNLKSHPLAKIQIIVKAIITIIGISVILQILRQLEYSGGVLLYQFSLISKIYGVYYLLIATGLIITIFYFIVLNNEWLVIKIAKSKEYISGSKEVLWFVSSFRIAFVFFGLFLLAFSIGHIITTILFIITLPMQCRDFITSFVEDRKVVDLSVVNLSQYFRTTCHLLITFLMIYFICGAKYFLNWQLKRRSITSNPNRYEGDKDE